MAEANIKTSELKGTILTLLGASCWGISGCCGQYLFTVCKLEAMWVVPWRLLFSGIVLMTIGFILNGKDNMRVFKSRKDTLHMAVFGLFGVLMSQFSYYMAIQHSNAATATVLQNLSPVMILVVVCIYRKKLPTWAEVTAIAFAVFGVFLIGTHGNVHQLQMTPQGLFWGLMAAVSAMFYITISGDLIQRYGTCQILGYGLFISGVATCMLIRPWTMPVVLTTEIVLVLSGSILIGSVIAYGLFLSGVSIVGPIKGSLYGSMEPIVSIIISVALLGAAFTSLDFVGFFLILAAVTILALRKN